MTDDNNWKNKLSPEQFRILRQKGTEPPFSGKLLNNKQEGMYQCGACSQNLFKSGTKFDSRSGWPSFYEAIPGTVKIVNDSSLGMQRVEALCSNCGSHLGHVFDDAPSQPTGQRYCINSLSLKFESEK